jgi:pSer/pThr/pTyr-binding forkhead associated (FHA) protein
LITCPKCSKDNQDHYKFCLGCGAELPRDAAPKPFSPGTPPHGMRAAQLAAPAQVAPAAGGLGGTVAISPSPGYSRAPVPAPVAPAAPAPVAPSAVAATVAAPNAGGAAVACPQCGHINSQSNLFCGSCGFRLGGLAARQASAPPPQVAPVAEAAPVGNLVLTALRADGTEAGTYQIPGAAGAIGRETGGIFAGDSYLSPRHATFRPAGAGRAMVKDEGSLNGVYKKLGRDAPIELKPNDVFRIGQEIIKYEPLAPHPPAADGVERLGAPSKGYIGRIALVIGRDETGNAFPIPEAGVHLGRERGDILFPEDGYVSGLHCRLTWDGQKLLLTDLGSSNGTFLRITSEADVRTGDVLLMGQQLFRIAM